MPAIAPRTTAESAAPGSAPSSPRDPDGEWVWTIHLRPLRSDVPAANRVRRLLKFALRVCGLRCVYFGADRLSDAPADSTAGE